MLEKAKLWFDFFDKRAIGVVTLETQVQMIRSILDVSASVIPLLALSHLKRKTLEAYMRNLSANKDILIQRCVDNLPLNYVSFHELMEMILKFRVSLLSASGARELLMGESKVKKLVPLSPIVQRKLKAKWFSESEDELLDCINQMDSFSEEGIQHEEYQTCPKFDIFDVGKDHSTKISVLSDDKGKQAESLSGFST